MARHYDVTMRWVLLWLVLLVGSAAFLTLMVRRVWHQMKALKAEVERASRRFDELLATSADRGPY